MERSAGVIMIQTIRECPIPVNTMALVGEQTRANPDVSVVALVCLRRILRRKLWQIATQLWRS
jgi:hypothetical protein